MKTYENENINILGLKKERQYEILGVNTPEQLKEIEFVYKVLEH